MKGPELWFKPIKIVLKNLNSDLTESQWMDLVVRLFLTVRSEEKRGHLNYFLTFIFTWCDGHIFMFLWEANFISCSKIHSVEHDL